MDTTIRGNMPNSASNPNNGDGKLNSFADIYGRDAPVIASFAQPRQDKVATPPPVIVPIEAPGA